MSEATNGGSANPTMIGRFIHAPPELSRTNIAPHKNSSTPANTEEWKTLNYTAYIRRLPEMNGKNADWEEESVRSAKHLTTREARKGA